MDFEESIPAQDSCPYYSTGLQVSPASVGIPSPPFRCKTSDSGPAVGRSRDWQILFVVIKLVVYF